MRGRRPNEGNYGLVPLQEIAEELGLSFITVRRAWKSGLRKLSATPEGRRMFMDHVRACAIARHSQIRARSMECRKELAELWGD